MLRLTRTTLLVAFGLAIAASTIAAPLAGATSSAGPTPSAARTITLYGSFNAPAGWGWTANNITEPGPTLTVNQGDVLTFHLFSNDTMTHQLIIDLDNSHSNTTGDAYSAQFSSKTTATVFVYTANQAGTFDYFCNIHGYAAQHGSLVVQATGGGGTPPPASDNTVLIIGSVIIVVAIVAVAAAMMMRRKKPQA